MTDAVAVGTADETPRGAALLRPRPRSRAVGALASIAAVVAATLLIYALREITPAVSNGVVYMLAVLLISTYWGLGLGLFTAVLSTFAFNFFHIPPTGQITISDPENYVALGLFLAAAIIASSVANLARARAEEAERRREEADLTADLARVLLGELDLREALASADHRLARALGLPSIAIEPREVEPDARHVALPLDVGTDRSVTLVVPAAIDPDSLERVRDRVVPALEALLAAALDRDELQAEVVETAALRKSDSVKTALLRSVSHDLRTPLTTILAASMAVGSPSLDEGERAELADSIASEAGRLSRLVDQLLDLSRLEAGMAEPERAWSSVDELLHSAAEEVGEDADDFVLSVDADIPLINADAAQLERALVNLLENAHRHSGGHPVKVRAGVRGSRIVVRIIDRGLGMSEAELDRIFEPFYRGDRDRSRAGSGLGLAIARGFVEANGGHVSAESLPGQGTTFMVELPREEAPRIAPAAGEHRP